jgi:hypothetical protein
MELERKEGELPKTVKVSVPSLPTWRGIAVMNWFFINME